MNGQTGLLHSFASDGACLSVEDPRGARHESALSCLTMMQSCASAAKLRAASPFSLVVISADPTFRAGKCSSSLFLLISSSFSRLRQAFP